MDDALLGPRRCRVCFQNHAERCDAVAVAVDVVVDVFDADVDSVVVAADSVVAVVDSVDRVGVVVLCWGLPFWSS